MRPLLTALLATLLLVSPLAPSLAAKPDLRPIDARMQRIVSQYRLEGASLWYSQNGQDLFTGHYGSYGPQTRVALASASKWVSALVLARLVERGTLRWDSTVGEFFPTAPADKHAITLSQLFSHTSGLPGEESGCIANPLTTLQACAGQILSGPVIAAPGAAFAYGGLSMQVAAAMAERATGQGWNTLFEQELTTPLGLTHTDYGATNTDPGTIVVPNPRIAGGVRGTLADYRRLMAMWQADGNVAEGPLAGQSYLTPATLRAMERDRTVGAARLEVPPSVAGAQFGYGFGFWILPTERPGAPVLVSSPGAFGFQGWVDGTAGIAGVFMVLDTNVRMSPEVRALQQDMAARLDFRRSTQGHGGDKGVVDAALDVLVEDLGLEGASLSVAANGQPAVTRHRGSYGDATRIPIASATKWASALVFARLVEQGSLDWDTRVGEWFPDAPAATLGITLEQLFSHTSGLPADGEGCVAQPFDSLQRCAREILARPLIAAPGQAFAYGSQSMQVAGAMAERATGLAWDDLFRREVAGPLGLVASDYAAGSDRPGYVSLPNPRIDGGMRSSLADYSRIVAMWAADGRVGQAIYLRPDTLRAMERDRTQGLPRLQVPPGATIYPGYGYGFGFWTLPTARAGRPTVYASPGAFGFTPWVDGAAGIAGVLMVRDQNIRVAPYAKAIIEASAAAFEIQRRTQGAAPPAPALPARAPGSAQQRLQRRPDVVAKPGLHGRHRVDAVGLETVAFGGDGLEQEGQ